MAGDAFLAQLNLAGFAAEPQNVHGMLGALGIKGATELFALNNLYKGKVGSRLHKS